METVEPQKISTATVEIPTEALAANKTLNLSQPPLNIVKTRDDRIPICFKGFEDEHGEKRFQIVKNEELAKLCDCPSTFSFEENPGWVTNDSFGDKELRQRIEPWLTALFQSEHLSLLLGSGITHAAHWLAAGGPATDLAGGGFTSHSDKIGKRAQESAKNVGRAQANLEDELRIANELLRGLEILEDEQAESLRKEINEKLKSFAKSILKSEEGIAQATETKRENAFHTLVNFLMSFASRTGTRDRLSIFTTNYDRLIEAGAEIAGLHLIDRFVGNLSPVFRSSRLDLDMHYNPPGIRGEPRYLEGVARFTKLHGSIDWIQTEGSTIRRMGLPFGAKTIDPFIEVHGASKDDAHRLMIYPNSAKDAETAQYPYVELFRDFASGICRPNSTLVTYGYSFGDDHINRVIRDMMTIPSTHLVIISRDDGLGRILKHYFDDIARPSQITLLLGPDIADLSKLVSHFLPKSAIDKATSRMSELLRARLGTEQAERPAPSEAPVGTDLNLPSPDQTA